jgi:hypothetical protein
VSKSTAGSNFGTRWYEATPHHRASWRHSGSTFHAVAAGRPRAAIQPNAALGVLLNLAADDPETQVRLAAFLRGLQELGWTEGCNLQIDCWGMGDIDRHRKNAEELVALGPDVILVHGSTIMSPQQKVRRTVPIVFVSVADPVAGGFVASLAGPGGNATGFTSADYSMSGKWLELLKQMASNVTRAGIIRDPAQFSDGGQLGAIQAVASLFGWRSDRSACATQRRSRAPLWSLRTSPMAV